MKPEVLKEMVRDWANIKRRQACDILGSPEAGELLADAKKFDLVVDFLTELCHVATPVAAPAPAVPQEPFDITEADVWHEGSESFYRAKLLRRLTPEEAFSEPPEVGYQPSSQPVTLTEDEINRSVYEHTKLNPNQAYDVELLAGIRAAIRAIIAASAPAVPQGWKLVPVEPTSEMLSAVGKEMSWCNPVGIFRKMLAATPAAPSQPVTLTEAERVKCLVASDCIGTVKMTYDSGPYEITRTSINASRLIDAIIAALREKEKAK